jgi:GNAT superfamily N-acetyltransferase
MAPSTSGGGAVAFFTEPFDRRLHKRDRFTCGEPSLDGWLKTQASPAIRSGSARVYVRTRAADAIGYYTLSMSSIGPSNNPDELPLGPRGVPAPAALIGRLATDTRYQGAGLGQDLLLDAILRAVLASRSIGATVIRVDALDRIAESFYAHHGFRPIRAGGREMFLPMRTAERTLQTMGRLSDS